MERANDYDRIGLAYAERRRDDPRLARAMVAALGGANSVVNVGAGAGSYELRGPAVVGVEPSNAMIRQRPAGAAPVVRGRAEALPFDDDAFDAALAVLTIHHWPDLRAGLHELNRVARQKIVLFTWDPQSPGFWLVRDYFPEMLARDRMRFPELDTLREILGDIRITRAPIPWDCVDGFLGAYWRRPEVYLDPAARAAMSSFALRDSTDGLARLAADLESGAWTRKHGHLLREAELDIGYCLVVADR